MNVRELRVGNYISVNNQARTVLAIDIEVNMFDHYIILGDGQVEDLDTVKPIPLTKEWIERAKFEPYEMLEGHFWKKPLRIIEIKGEYYFRMDGGVIKLQYVHQLQNLYLTLTGKEIY